MRPSITRADLQQLALLRLREAEALLQAGLFDGCCYLCGYVLELALKACVCRHLSLNEYPEEELRESFKTHKFTDLLLLAGLTAEVEAKQIRSSAFSANWSEFEKWRVEDRYQIKKSFQDAQGRLMGLKDQQEGVLTWLSTRW